MSETENRNQDYLSNPEALGKDILSLLATGKEGIDAIKDWLSKVEASYGITSSSLEFKFPEQDALTPNEEYLQEFLSKFSKQVLSALDAVGRERALKSRFSQVLEDVRSIPGLEGITEKEIETATAKYPYLSPVEAVVRTFGTRISSEEKKTPIIGIPGKETPPLPKLDKLPRGAELAEILEENPDLIPQVSEMVKKGEFRLKKKEEAAGE